MIENAELTQQIYVMKTKFGAAGEAGAEGMGLLSGEDEKIRRIEKEQMVELLKRNHDVLMEKHELTKKRNELLEKTAIEKEKLYVDIKQDNDRLLDQLHRTQQDYQDSKNTMRMLEKKL